MVPLVPSGLQYYRSVFNQAICLSPAVVVELAGLQMQLTLPGRIAWMAAKLTTV